MIYNDLVAYDQPAVQYDGTVIVKIQGILNPIILNNIKINFSGNEDYSTGTTIGVISVDVSPVGIITIETNAREGAALIQATEITIYSDTLIGL
jgi:hypothetical protein